MRLTTVLLGVTLVVAAGCAARKNPPSFSTPDTAFQAGEDRFAAGDYKKALLAYNDVLLAGPNPLCPRALYQCAVCFDRLGDRIDAETVFRKLITQYPNSPEAASAREALTGVQIVVTAGSLSQPYKALGPVHFDTVGKVNVGSVLVDALTRSRLAADVQATPKARCDQLNELLKAQAFQMYGNRVDAIINVTCRNDPSGDVFADGLAVAFTSPAASVPSARTGEQRLKELQDLLDKGLINREEYERKRAEILREL
ncbi:MAG: tetratricopeptide repeat protein [Candidatus Binatia bacterium]